jgi:hypothetical protein
MVFYRNSLIELLKAFDFVFHLRLTDQHNGHKEAMIQLKIEEKSYFFQVGLGEQLCFIDDQERFFACLRILYHFLVQLLKALHLGFRHLIYAKLIEYLLNKFKGFQFRIDNDTYIKFISGEFLDADLYEGRLSATDLPGQHGPPLPHLSYIDKTRQSLFVGLRKEKNLGSGTFSKGNA